MKSRIYTMLSSALIAAVMVAAMVIVPASGANDLPKPPSLPTIGKVPAPKSAGPKLPKPLKPGPSPSSTTKIPRPKLPQRPKVVAKPVPRVSSTDLRLITSQSLGVKNASELDGAAICMHVSEGGENTKVTNFFDENELGFEPVLFDGINELIPALKAGVCDVVALGASNVDNQISAADSDGSKFIILPDIIQ